MSHEVVVEEATPAEAAKAAGINVRQALRELDGLPASHGADHVRMYLRSALIWLGQNDD